MYPFPDPNVGMGGIITLIGTATGSAAAFGNAAAPLASMGAQVGDILVGVSVDASSATSQNGFDANASGSVGAGGLWNAAFRKLTSADFAAPPYFTNSGFANYVVWAVYRGTGAAAAFKGAAVNASTSTITKAGYAPANGAAMVAVYAQDGATPVTMTSPVGGTRDVINGAGGWTPAIFSKLTQYAGEDVTIGTTSGQEVLHLIEITHT